MRKSIIISIVLIIILLVVLNRKKKSDNIGLGAIIKPVGNGIFGPIYDQFKDEPKKAIKHLLKVQEGECINALYHDEIGYIDIVWGENNKDNIGYGLKHIYEKHGKEIERLGFKIEDFLPLAINFGVVVPSVDPKKVFIQNRYYKIVLSKEWKSEKKNLVITVYDLIRK